MWNKIKLEITVIVNIEIDIILIYIVEEIKAYSPQIKTPTPKEISLHIINLE